MSSCILWLLTLGSAVRIPSALERKKGCNFVVVSNLLA